MTLRPSGAGNGVQNGNQDAGTDNRDDDATPETEIGIGNQQIHKDTTDEGAHQADDNIADETVATTAHDSARDKTSDQTDDKPDDETRNAKSCGQSHTIAPFFSLKNLTCNSSVFLFRPLVAPRVAQLAGVLMSYPECFE